MTSFLKLSKSFINQGHTRSIKAKKNIIASLILKGTSILITIILVPLTINYVNPTRYGIWLTLSSIVGWFSFFDVGLTNGLKNKFAEAKANGDDNTAQTYVSTTYAILVIVFTLIWVVFIIANHFINWTNILHISPDLQHEISTLVLIVFTYFCIQFILRIITTILIADQQSAKSSLIDVLGQLLSLICIFVLLKTTNASLVNLGIVLCSAPLLILICSNFFFFYNEYKKYKPSLSSINFSRAKGLFSLGLKFFIIQIAGIIQFESANIIIARNFTLADVTAYNIVYKYFGIIYMVAVIFTTPFWSASTEAFYKNDIDWIKNGMKRYRLLNIVLFFFGFIILIFSKQIYNMWLGQSKINISFSLSLWGFISFSLLAFSLRYTTFLNGISALRLQFFTCILSPILYVLISQILIKHYKLGLQSLFIAAIVSNFYGYIIAPLQYYMIIQNGKRGIWRK